MYGLLPFRATEATEHSIGLSSRLTCGLSIGSGLWRPIWATSSAEALKDLASFDLACSPDPRSRPVFGLMPSGATQEDPTLRHSTAVARDQDEVDSIGFGLQVQLVATPRGVALGEGWVLERFALEKE